MVEYLIDSQESLSEFLSYIKDERPLFTVEDSLVVLKDFKVKFTDEYKSTLNFMDDDIFGLDKTEGIISLEVKDDKVYLFKLGGEVEVRDCTYWILSPLPYDNKFKKIEGNNWYKYIRTFSKEEDYRKAIGIYSKKDTFNSWDTSEAQYLYQGISPFKNIRFDDLKLCGFDIEASGLTRDENSQLYVIANTIEYKGVRERKQFRVDQYDTVADCITAWCDYIREKDPDILVAHNGFGYDLPFLQHIATMNGVELLLGRDGSPAEFSKKDKNIRVDGSQSWQIKNCKIFGRHIVDTMLLAVKYDIGRNYPSWGLKAIIEYEGLVKEGRQFYDASKIRENWYIPEEREKIVKYCEEDGDDALNLYKLMAPSFFYMNQSIPKNFQAMLLGASGSWLNSILVRAYLQKRYSIPRANESEKVHGGISFGVPGCHKNVVKIDVISMYPSIMREYYVYDDRKDPNGIFNKMVEVFTLKRFAEKKKFKETGDKYYDDLQAASKILINSSYGLLGTPGLNFNSFKNADFITGIARQIIRKTILWSTGKDIDTFWSEYEADKDIIYNSKVDLKEQIYHNFTIVNADTDSISFKKVDESPYTKEEISGLINEINTLIPEKIKYEDDGYFNNVIVVKAKNYVLKSGDKIKFKGSSLTDGKKELALTEFLERVITECLIDEKVDYVDLYEEYIQEALNVKNIKRWSVKKSISEKLVSSDRANETKVMDAIGDMDFQLGDKIYVFNKIEGMKQDVKNGQPVFLKDGSPKMIENNVLCLSDNFDGDYDKWHYVERVYKTISILENVVDMGRIVKYHLKGNRKLLEV